MFLGRRKKKGIKKKKKKEEKRKSEKKKNGERMFDRIVFYKQKSMVGTRLKI